MKKLGAYINGDAYGDGTILEQNTFVWYEVIRRLTPKIEADVYEVSIWGLKGGYPNGRKPDAKFKTTNPQLIEDYVIPMKDIPNKYCIEWEDRTWKIQECMTFYAYAYDYELIKTLELDRIGSNACHWSWEGEQAMSTLKNATVKLIRTALLDIYPVTIKEELKKSMEKAVMKSALNSCYGDCSGGFTTTPGLSEEDLRRLRNKSKETETMTVTDAFLKNLNGITITSTYSKLERGDGLPYYIYYPEMEITEDIADTLLTVLLMAKRDYIKKVVFNPEKGTTAISRNSDGDMMTVRCKDAKFDYILGYEMARLKMYLGHNDYNWFNKIKNHRKTHIEYTEKPTEPKAKKTSKKGGKKS